MTRYPGQTADEVSLGPNLLGRGGTPNGLLPVTATQHLDPQIISA